MWKHESSQRVLRLQSFNFGQVKTFMILVKSKSLVKSSLFVSGSRPAGPSQQDPIE
ncbi:hypothetical protein YC2023_073446 [Brassica napus]